MYIQTDPKNDDLKHHQKSFILTILLKNLQKDASKTREAEDKSVPINVNSCQKPCPPKFHYHANWMQLFYHATSNLPPPQPSWWSPWISRLIKAAMWPVPTWDPETSVKSTRISQVQRWIYRSTKAANVLILSHQLLVLNMEHGEFFKYL